MHKFNITEDTIYEWNVGHTDRFAANLKQMPREALLLDQSDPRVLRHYEQLEQKKQEATTSSSSRTKRRKVLKWPEKHFHIFETGGKKLEWRQRLRAQQRWTR